MIKDDFSNRINKLWDLTSEIYKETKRPEAKYLWQNHVQTVAKNAAKLSGRFGGDKDSVVAGALLHDIADIWLERDDPTFDLKSQETAENLLIKSGFSPTEIKFINEEVIAPHSCLPNKKPETLEGKLMATADAVAHLTTNFYQEIYLIFFKHRKTESEYKQWVSGKLNRDFYDKIWFPQIQDELKQAYNNLLVNFK
jgi:HD superfamily phosphodiesterase